jgi:hypothetical protein
MGIYNTIGNALDAAAKAGLSSVELFAAKTVTHAIAGGAFSIAQGGSFGAGAATGAAAGATSFMMQSTPLADVKGSEGVILRTSIAAAAGGTASVLSGGKFANGAITGAMAHLFNNERLFRQYLNELREKLVQSKNSDFVQSAREELGSRAWDRPAVSPRWGAEDEPKCNLYVYDKRQDAGMGIPLINGWRSYINSEWATSPPAAADWANTALDINATRALPPGSAPQPGDIVSDGKHMGIVILPGLTASATGHDGVVINSWGFRPKQHPVFRRYIGED